jgi:hypothetical protein
MALIDCPECRARISDCATSCPRCGRPIAQPVPYATPAPPPKIQRPRSSAIRVVRILLGLTVALFALGAAYQYQWGNRDLADPWAACAGIFGLFLLITFLSFAPQRR